MAGGQDRTPDTKAACLQRLSQRQYVHAGLPPKNVFFNGMMLTLESSFRPRSILKTYCAATLLVHFK